MTAALELAHIEKRFGPVRANRDVTLSVARNSIHGIVGENGAGKSTLMSIIYGFYEADAGEIRVAGKLACIRSPKQAIALGIGMVHQHFMLVEPLSVIENVMLGAEGGAWLARGERALRGRLKQLADDYGLAVDPDATVGDLPVGLQQRVEILKALVRGAQILILDEPTAVLTPAEADQLFAMLRVLKAEGRTIILITHKLREILAVTDRVSVMRSGEMVAHFDTSATSAPQLADAMVGRKVLLRIDKSPARPGPVLLEARDLMVRDGKGTARLDRVSLALRGGEIVGIAGVSGNGQSELLEALAGLAPLASGEILFEGMTLTAQMRNPENLRRLGLMHVPEDRQRRGLVMSFEANESAMLGFQNDPAFGSILFDRQAIIRDCAAKMQMYDVRPPDPRQKTANFSGGNQQKIVLAREIERAPKVLIVGQPTRGVDIGAIEFIHGKLVAMRDRGTAILVVSVELDEVMALCDRILVMCGGRITGERLPGQTNARDLGLLMAGVTERAA